jgi:hypothetical protein
LKSQVLETELSQCKQDVEEISQHRDNYWQDRIEELFGIITDLEKVIE